MWCDTKSHTNDWINSNKVVNGIKWGMKWRSLLCIDENEKRRRRQINRGNRWQDIKNCDHHDHSDKWKIWMWKSCRGRKKKKKKSPDTWNHRLIGMRTTKMCPYPSVYLKESSSWSTTWSLCIMLMIISIMMIFNEHNIIIISNTPFSILNLLLGYLFPPLQVCYYSGEHFDHRHHHHHLPDQHQNGTELNKWGWDKRIMMTRDKKVLIQD